MATLTAPGDARKDGAEHPSSLDEPAAGARLGRYVIVERLGAGGMSQVYRADDPELRRSVAIKLMRGDLALSPAARERFAREGQAMAALTHPNVATVFDVGQHGDRFFLAIELLEGGTLNDWLATPRGEREVTEMMRAAARGLVAAHACGIVHRDFKPENVLLTRDGTPRVSDFGLAASNPSGDQPPGNAGDDRLTAAGAVMGTPAYMAPEQRDGKPADERADQYSLCLVWLEALGRDRAAAAGDPGKARGSSALLRVLMRGLDPDPARRWPGVAALLAALDADDRTRRRRRVIAGLAVAAVLAAAAGAWAITREPTGPPAAQPQPAARVLKRHKSGEGQWRMTLAGDGETVVRDNAARDALWIEQIGRPGSTPLPLPPDARVSPRMDAFPGISQHAETVLVRMEDSSVWVTGRDRAPIRLRADAAGPACLHPSGNRAVVSTYREPIEVRSTVDGSLLATGPDADLCTWLGDRLVLGMRLRATSRVLILEPDGRLRDLIELPGEIGTLAVDVRGRIVAIHHLRDGDDSGSGRLTALSADGAPAPVTLRQGGGATSYQFLAGTARGLFLAEVPISGHIELAPFDPARPAAPLALRSLDTGTSGDGAPVWLTGDRLVFGHDGGHIASQQITGPPDLRILPGTGQPVARSGGELLLLQRETPGGASDLQPRCTLVAVALASQATRIVRSWPCSELASLRCHDDGPCAVGLLAGDGDQVALSILDSRDGTMAPPVATRPLGGTPHVAIAPDGRWLIESGGALTIFDPAAATAVALATPGWDIEDAVWGPDGAVYAASRSVAGFTVMHIAPDATAAVTVLATSQQAQLNAPIFSPDGRWVAVPAGERLPVYLLIPPR